LTQNTDFQYDEDYSRQQKSFALAPDMVAQRRKMHISLALQKGEIVLDIGSGDGSMIDEMADSVGASGKLTGLDISETMINMSRKLCCARSNVEFVQATATKLPFSNSTFDVITSAQCLCYVPDIDLTLAEIFRVLKPGGRVVILDSDWDTLIWHSGNQLLMDKIMSWYISIYSDAHVPRTLSGRLKKTGFIITDRTCFPIVNWTHNSDTFAGLQIEFVRTMVENDDAISNDEFQEWIVGLDKKTTLDECFFSLNRYIFCAAKPTGI